MQKNDTILFFFACFVKVLQIKMREMIILHKKYVLFSASSGSQKSRRRRRQATARLLSGISMRADAMQKNSVIFARFV